VEGFPEDLFDDHTNSRCYKNEMTFNPVVALRVLLRSWTFLILALLVSLSAALYQRLTGPTHPKKITIEMAEHTYSFKALRSHETTEPALIRIPSGLKDQHPHLKFRRFPTQEAWTQTEFKQRVDSPEMLIAELPIQPPAGKMEYQIVLNAQGKETFYPESPVRLRYKDPVPDWILIPHVYSMFAALLFGAWAFIESIIVSKRNEPMAIPTAVQLCTCFFILGGFILGPIVQKFAFGEYWTGFPFGDDFTDNKVLTSVIFWLVAFYFNFRKPNSKSAILAALIMFAMYMIPHSFGGSQFDYSENKIKTGLQK
jgi:hypothetical protein